MPDYPRITSLRRNPKPMPDQVHFYPNGEIGYWSAESRLRVRERSIPRVDFNAMPEDTRKLILEHQIKIRPSTDENTQ